jgi:hypothetical protein
MAFLSANIPLLFGALSSVISIVSMTAVTVTGYHYLRAMEASQARVHAEQDETHRAASHY